ncbi:MAG: ImmA/IrrE family metallo-endopeptidase [Candidatus Obscuribacterales bacterium]|nr:ImmA/IrrE family metallo-endopeptidase [Candidatus Obscuribacterales bacterium]
MTPLNPDFLNLAEMPRQAALRLLQECNALSAPIDLVALCQMNDWPLYFMCLNEENRAATTLMDGESIQIVVNTKHSDNEDGFSSESSLRRRQRFSLAHEVAHAWLNSHNDFGLQKQLLIGNPHGSRYHLMRESQANEFASELLLPQTLVEQRLKTFRWDNVIEESGFLGDEFDVSLTVALRRITGLAPFPALMFYFSTDGKAPQGAIPSKYFSDTELPKPSGASMPRGSLVARLAADPQSRVSTMRNLSASVWFPQNRKSQAFKLQEWAKRIGEKGFLTFIAINEDEDWSGSHRDSRYDRDDDDDWG